MLVIWPIIILLSVSLIVTLVLFLFCTSALCFSMCNANEDETSEERHNNASIAFLLFYGMGGFAASTICSLVAIDSYMEGKLTYQVLSFIPTLYFLLLLLLLCFMSRTLSTWIEESFQGMDNFSWTEPVQTT